MTTIAQLASVLAERSKQYRELMSPVIAQVAEQAEMQKRLMAPFVEMMRSHAAMQRKFAEAVAGPLRQQEELRRNVLSSTIADLSRIHDAHKKLVGPIISSIMSQHHAHKRLMEPFITALRHQEELRTQMISPIAEQLARHAQIQKAIIAEFAHQQALHQRQLSSSFMRELESLRSLKLDALDDVLRKAATESVEYTADEDTSAVDAIIADPRFHDLPTVEQINHLIEAVGKLKSGAARRVFSTVLTIIITLVLTDFYAKFKEHFFGPERPKVLVREIRTIVKNSRMDPVSIREYRVIARYSVAVQLSRRPKSQRVWRSALKWDPPRR
jgi:hypothetical protein